MGLKWFQLYCNYKLTKGISQKPMCILTEGFSAERLLLLTSFVILLIFTVADQHQVYTLRHAKNLFFYPSCQSRPTVGEHFHPWRLFSSHLVFSFQTAGESRVPFRPLGRLFTPLSIVMRVCSGGECHVTVIRHPAGSFWVGSVVQFSAGVEKSENGDWLRNGYTS